MAREQAPQQGGQTQQQATQQQGGPKPQAQQATPEQAREQAPQQGGRARAFDPDKALLTKLAQSGTGKSKLKALATIEAKDRADYLAQAAKLVPGGTLRKIEALLK